MITPYSMQEIVTGLGLDLGAVGPERQEKRATITPLTDGPFLKGRRHDGMKKVASHLHHAGLPPERLRAVLLEENERRCNPVLSQQEVESIAKWFEGKESAAATRPAPRIELVSFADLMAAEIPEPKWVIRGILPEGVTVLCGAPKIGKSWLAMDWSIGVASGSLAMGQFPCNQGRVLHLALEDNPRRFRTRLAKMLDGKPAPEYAFFVDRLAPFTDNPNGASGLDSITDWLLDNEDAALVVIDTFARVRPRNPKDRDVYMRDYADVEALQNLAAKFAIAVVLLHHTNKGRHDDEYNRVSGSTGIIGAADTIDLMERPQRGEVDATLFISGRDVEERKGALSFTRTSGRWKWVGEASEVAVSHERQEVRDTLRAIGGPAGPTEIGEAMEPQKKKATVHKLLKKMLEAGHVEVAPGEPGKYVLPQDDTRYGPGR